MNLKQGQMANVEYHRCRQERCAFFLQGGCKECQECKASPYEIKNGCSRCLSCEGEEGELRWNDEKLNVLKDLQIEKLKNMGC